MKDFKTFEEFIGEGWVDDLPGGKGDNTKPEDVDREEYKVGQKIEIEHTDDPSYASEITVDHLTEDPKYYSKLIAAGLVDEKDALKLAKEYGWNIPKESLEEAYGTGKITTKKSLEAARKFLKKLTKKDIYHKQKGTKYHLSDGIGKKSKRVGIWDEATGTLTYEKDLNEGHFKTFEQLQSYTELNEAFGVKKVAQACEEVAKARGVDYTKSKAVKKKVGYGSMSTETRYQIGPVEVMTKSVKVPGMGGDMYIYIVDPTDANKGTMVNDWDPEKKLKELINKGIDDVGGQTNKSAKEKPMAKKAIDKFVKDIEQSGEVDSSMAYDFAQNFLDDEPGLEAGIKKYYKVEEPLEWLADRI